MSDRPLAYFFGDENLSEDDSQRRMYSQDGSRLEMVPCKATFVMVIDEFVSRGGIWIPLVDPLPFRFGLRSTDVIYPICTQGVNRSQALHATIQLQFGQRRHSSPHLVAPHGAGGGNDPFLHSAVNSEESSFKYIKDVSNFGDHSDPLNSSFVSVFGRPKEERFGEELGRKEGYIDNINSFDDFDNCHWARTHMRRIFDEQYFSRPSTSSSSSPAEQNGLIGDPISSQKRRRVFITFARAAHITMFRLIENNISLSDCVVLGLNYNDKVLDSKDYQSAYTQMKNDFSSIFVPCVDEELKQ